jgi:AmiR/NasT family two-component response regulator
MTTPNFVGSRALILHRADEGIDRLERQLKLIGFTVARRWEQGTDWPCDMVLVDADQGWDGLLPWQPGAAKMPVVALLGSEAPGRIAWAIAQGAGAIIAKPISAAAVYPALVLATHAFHERLAAEARIGTLTERLRLRGLVLRAVESIGADCNLGEEDAYRRLRSFAMTRRMTIEQAAAAVLAGQKLPEAS